MAAGFPDRRRGLRGAGVSALVAALFAVATPHVRADGDLRNLAPSAEVRARAQPHGEASAAASAPPAHRDEKTRARPATRPVILISLDSFHPDYLDRDLMPTLQRLAREGVRAKWLQPSYPTKTFPNHYTLVTGLAPDRHGIVDNVMRDPRLGRFTLQDRKAVGDGRWWGGEPVWIGAQRQGLRTATLFWPGSEAAIGGERPDRWHPFDAAMPVEARIAQVLAWLGEDEHTRPHFITLYLEQIDTAGHRHGPDSPELAQAMRATDAALARLVDGIARLGLADAVQLVIVSDHGMAPLDPEREIVLEDVVDPSWVEVVALAEIASFDLRDAHRDEAERALLAPHEGMTCRRRNALPARWRYGSHPRVPEIVCQLDEGWRIRRRERFNPWQNLVVNRGAHGYDPSLPSMRGLFVAHGSAFREGLVVAPFDNVHVYPLLMRLLGVEAAPSDGDAAVTAPMLRSAPSDEQGRDQKSVQP
jgi:predicted AlkP superfamily pyrophosphatase or phosphodiesterase